MRTTTLFLARELAESELATVLEQQFDATWFPGHHRCSIETEDAFVSVDFDKYPLSSLSPERQQELATQLGFQPTIAFHISSSSYHAGSPGLAEKVLETLSERLGGRGPVAA